jgi:hypothetical protein
VGAVLIWDLWIDWCVYLTGRSLKASVERSAKADAQWLELVGRG